MADRICTDPGCDNEPGVEHQHPGRIVGPGGEPFLTEAQVRAAVADGDMPPCAGPEGRGDGTCPHGPAPVMIAGYDDRMRCPPCNKVHIALVEREAGASAPNATEPRFVSAALDRRARIGDTLRKRRIGALFDKMEAAGHTGRPTESVNLQPIEPGEPRDMKEAMARDEHGTREEGIDDAERRRRIHAKYSKRSDGNKLR